VMYGFVSIGRRPRSQCPEGARSLRLTVHLRGRECCVAVHAGGRLAEGPIRRDFNRRRKKTHHTPYVAPTRPRAAASRILRRELPRTSAQKSTPAGGRMGLTPANLAWRAAALLLAASLAALPTAAQRDDRLDQPLLTANMCGAGDSGDTHFTLAATGDTFP